MSLELRPYHTERLLLRPIELEDGADLFALYGDSRVMENATMPPLVSIDDMLKLIQTYFMAYRQRGVPPSMVMELKERGTVIGIIDYHTVHHNRGELGYMIRYDYWQQGYLEEALSGMVDMGFEQLHLHRLEAMVDPANVASWKALEACEFQKEGLLRKYCKLSDGKYHDLILYSLLQEEYEEKRNEKTISCEV